MLKIPTSQSNLSLNPEGKANKSNVSFSDTTILRDEASFVELSSERMYTANLRNTTVLKPIRTKSFYDQSINEESIMIGASFSNQRQQKHQVSNFTNMEIDSVSRELQRRFYLMLKGEPDISNAAEGLRGAAKYLIEKVDDNISTNDLDITIDQRSSYKEMLVIERNLETLDSSISEITTRLQALQLEHDKHRGATTRKVEEDQAAIKKVRYELEIAQKQKENEIGLLSEALKRNPSKNDQLIEYLVTNIPALQYLMPLHQAIQRYDWLILTKDDNATESDKLKKSRRYWLQNKILGQHIPQSDIARQNVEFNAVKTDIKNSVKRIVKITAEEEKKTALAEEVADLMDDQIAIEAKKRVEENERKVIESRAKLEAKIKDSEIKSQNLEILVKNSEELIKKASIISVEFVRGYKKSEVGTKSLIKFNNEIKILFEKSGIDLENNADSRIESLIQAYQVTRFLNSSENLNLNIADKAASEDVTKLVGKITESPFLYRSDIAEIPELESAKKIFAEKVSKSILFKEKSSVVINSINNLAVIALRSEVLKEKLQKERNIIAKEQSRVVAKLKNVRAKYKELSNLEDDDYKVEDPVEVAKIILGERWSQEAGDLVGDFYYTGTKDSAEEKVDTILAGKEFSRQYAALTEILTISDSVIEQATRIKLEEETKTIAANKRLEQEELLRQEQQQKLKEQIEKKNQAIATLSERTLTSLEDLSKKIEILIEEKATKDDIKQYRADCFGNENILSHKVISFLTNGTYRYVHESNPREKAYFAKGNLGNVKQKLEAIIDEKLTSENIQGMSKLEELDYKLTICSEVYDLSNKFDEHLTTVIQQRHDQEAERLRKLKEQQEQESQRKIDLERQPHQQINEFVLESARKKKTTEQLLQEKACLWKQEYEDALSRETEAIKRYTAEMAKHEEVLSSTNETDKDIAKLYRKFWLEHIRYAQSNKRKVESQKDILDGKARNLGPYPMDIERTSEIEKLQTEIAKLEAGKLEELQTRDRELVQSGAKGLFEDQDSERTILRETEGDLERLKRYNTELLLELKQVRFDISTVNQRIKANRKIGEQEIEGKEEQIRKLKIREKELSSQIKQSEASEREANLSYVEIKKVAVENLAIISYRALEKVSEKSELLERVLGRNNNKIAQYFKGLATIIDEKAAIDHFFDVYTEHNPKFLEDLEAIRKLTQQVLEEVDQEVQRKSEQQKKLELREQRQKHDGIIEYKDKVLQKREGKLQWSEVSRARVQLEKEQQEKSFDSEIDNANKCANEKEAASEIESVQKWLHFARQQDLWTNKERTELQESIIKQAVEVSSLPTVLKKLFSSTTIEFAPVLAKTLLDQSSIEDQKRILSETKSIFETIIDNVRQSEAKKIKSYKENFVKLKNQLELETILRSAHELLVNDKDVKQTEVEEIIQEIQKRRRWNVDALFTGFHVKRPKPDFSALVTEQLENLQNSKEQIERIDQAKQIISEIRDGISARKAEKEKAVSKKAIVDHLQRTYSFLEDKNLTTEEKVELLSRKELISANKDKIKKAIGSLFRKPNFAEIANEVSDPLNAEDIKKLAEDIDIESRKIEQEVFTIILVKEGDKYRKLVNSERLDKEKKILAQKEEFDQKIESEVALKAERVQEISNLKNEIATLKQKIEEKVSINEGETSELKRLKQNLTQKEKELSTANDLVAQEKTRANSAEIKLTSLNDNLIELHKRLKVLNSELEQEKEKAEKEKEAILKELQAAKDDKNLQVEKILKLEKQILDLESKIGTNESEKDKLIKSLQSELELAKGSIVGRIQEIEGLKVLLQGSENKTAIEKQDAEFLINQLQQQISQSNLELQKSKEGYEERIRELLLEIKNVEAQKLLSDKEKTVLEKLQKELGLEKEKLKDANILLDQEKERANKFDQKIESEVALKAERVQEISNLKNEIATLKQKIEEKVSINEGETSELKRLKQNLTQKEKELSTANDLVAQEKTRANSAEIKLTSLNDNLIELHKRLKVLNSELEQEKEKAEKEKEAILKELQAAKDDKNLQVEKILKLEKQILDLESKIGTNESEKDKLIKSLQSELELAKGSIVGRIQEIEGLKVLLQGSENKTAIEKQDAEFLINQLQQQISQSNLELQKSKEGYEERIRELLLEIKNVEAQKLLSDKEKTVLEKLQKELGLEKEKLKDANILLDQEKERANKFEAELTRIQNEVLPQLKRELEDAKSSISRQQQEILEFKNKISQVLEEIIRQKKDSDLLINSLKQEIASLKSKLSDGDLEKAEKIRKLEEDLRLALKNVEDKTAELELEKEKLKQSELEKAAILTKDLKDQEILNARILDEQNELKLLETESQKTIESLQNRIVVLEQGERDRGLVDNNKDLAIAELKEKLGLEQEKLRELKQKIELEKERFAQALASLENQLMKNEENLTKANQRIKELQEELLIMEKNELLDIDEKTDLVSLHDENATQHVSDLSIEELNDRFRETNANSRNKSNPYTSVKIVTALNKIRNIMKSFDEKVHSNPMWENIWNDHSLQNVNDSQLTLTSGDKGVLARFVLKKSEKSVTNNPHDIAQVIHVSKQLIKMFPDWENFYKDLIKSKTVNLVLSGNPSTSPAPRQSSEKEKTSLINML